MESPDGRVVLTCEDLEKTGIRFAIPEDYTNQAQIGLYLDAVCKSSCRLTVVSAETGETLYQLWIAFDKETPELQQAVRALFYDTYDYDFAQSDSYFRSMKSTRNKAMYAFLRLKYPYQLGDEYAILFRNFLKRFATNALSFSSTTTRRRSWRLPSRSACLRRRILKSSSTTAGDGEGGLRPAPDGMSERGGQRRGHRGAYPDAGPDQKAQCSRCSSACRRKRPGCAGAGRSVWPVPPGMRPSSAR
jgi:hypothetical protein